ncbi:MAG: sporulation protein [bacterium]
MSAFNQLKQKLNVNGPRIEISTNTHVYHQSDRINGTVHITAPDYRIFGNSIKISLKDFWTEVTSNGKSTQTRTVHKIISQTELQGSFELESLFEYTFPFQFDLPNNCRLSTRGEGLCLIVSLDIPKAIDPQKRQLIEVVPSPSIMTIIQACEQKLGFSEKIKSRKWNKKTLKTTVRLQPPESLESELDYLAFSLLQSENGGVLGEIIFNLQEHSIGDYLKAMLGKDKISQPFKIDADLLNHPNSQDKIARIVTEFKEKAINSK